MSLASGNDNKQVNSPNNFKEQKPPQHTEESEAKLPSELDELIIDNKKSNIQTKKEQIMLDNIIQKLHPMSERRGRFEENEKPKDLNIIITKNILTEEEIRFLCKKALEIFMEEPVLLEVSAPVNICGDTHGQFNDLLRLLIKYPQNFFLLRGNHESELINHVYGFYDECKRRYNTKIYKLFSDCFNWLPISAIVDDRILCMHGGISPELTSLDKIRKIVRPTEVPDKGLLCDLLWSDPDKNAMGWGGNERGVSVTFNENIVEKMVEDLDIDLVCRAHQVVEKGYDFFANKKLVTVFSAPNYCGQFDNAGAMMLVDENLVCGFKILIPKIKNETLSPMMYKQLIRNKTPPPKNRDFQKDDSDEDEKKNINNKILEENTNNNQ